MNKEKLVGIFDKHNPNTPMSEDETMGMVNIMMGDDKSFSIDINELHTESEIYQHFKPLIESFQGQVFLKRLKNLTSLKMSLGAFAILMQYMPSPGACVMYVFYLYYKLPENTLITIDKFAELFPWGFFSEQQLNDIWSAQKVRTDDHNGYTCIGAHDNMIDYLEIWK